MNILQEICKVINGTKSFIITAHKNPDGDAIGSMLALAISLEKIGKISIPISSQRVPNRFDFLPERQRIRKKLPKGFKPDVLITLDCGDKERVDYNPAKDDDIFIINIDHHISNDRFGDINYIDVKASAVAEQVYKILQRLNIDIDKEIATLLYFALITDTGNFKFSNTTSNSFKLASRLAKYNIDISSIYQKAFEDKSIVWLKLFEITLNRLKSCRNNKVLWSILQCEDFDKFPIDDVGTREIIDILRGIRGVKVAIMFKEYKKGEIKISFRSNEGIDVNAITKKFGGGGHKSAAGCITKGNMDEIEKIVLDEVLKTIY